jgi:hypothetical protein
MLLRSGSFMVGETKQKRQNKRVSMKLIGSIAPARAENEAGVVAKADQKNKLQRLYWMLQRLYCSHENNSFLSPS